MDRKVKAACVSVISNSFLTIGKLVVGLMMGSVSVISEAVHSGMDLVAALIAFFAVRKAAQPADAKHRYGHGKFENVAGIIEALLIIGAAMIIIWQAANKFFTATPVEALGLGALIMGFSAGVNLAVSQYLFKVARETGSPALEADAWHLRTDVYTSAGVLGGIGAMHLTGWQFWDPLTAVVIAVLIGKAGFKLIADSGASILDVKLPEPEEEAIRAAVTQYGSEFVEFHALRTRKSGSERHIDLHLVMPRHSSLDNVHGLCDRIEDAITDAVPKANVLIHVEPCDEKCEHCVKREECEVE